MAALVDEAFSMYSGKQAYEVAQTIIAGRLAGTVPAAHFPSIRDTHASVLLSTAGGTCDPLVLASVCSCNKELRLNCLKLLREQPLKQATVLLAGVEETVCAAAEPSQERSSQSVLWLLDTVLPADVLLRPSLINSLVRIPNIPLKLAERLCNRGLYVPYDDIVAAARGPGRVQGAAQPSSFECSSSTSCGHHWAWVNYKNPVGCSSM